MADWTVYISGECVYIFNPKLRMKPSRLSLDKYSLHYDHLLKTIIYEVFEDTHLNWFETAQRLGLHKTRLAQRERTLRSMVS